MPTNITDVDEYTTTIVAPADGDSVNGSAPEEMGQGLANRTYNHKLRLDAAGEYVQCSISMSSLADAGVATLAITDQSGGASIDTNELVFPSLGVWDVTVTVPGVTLATATDNAAATFTIAVNGGTSYQMKATRPGSGTGANVSLSTRFFHDVTSLAVDRPSLINSCGVTVSLSSSGSGLLVARRIS